MAPVFVVELSGDSSVASVRGQNIAVDTDGMETLVKYGAGAGAEFWAAARLWAALPGVGRPGRAGHADRLRGYQRPARFNGKPGGDVAGGGALRARGIFCNQLVPG